MNAAAAPVDTSSVARPGAFLGRITRQVREAAARLLARRTHAGGRRPVVLDVGCGNGLFFAEAGEVGARRVGSDLDLDLLKEAGRVFTDNQVGGVGRVCSDANALPFLTGSVDTVLLLNTLVNVPDESSAERLLRELVRVCRPGGRLLLDIRNGLNPALRLRYWLHNRRGDFTTRGYRLSAMERMFATLNCSLVAHPVGGRFPFGRPGYLLEVLVGEAI